CDDSLDPTFTYVAIGDRVVGYILRRSQHKLSTQQFLKKLRQFLPSSKIQILSGDPDLSAGEEYLKLGADIAYKGNLQPEEKAQEIQPQSVFVGDGLNDTLALSKADVSIRVGERIRGFCVADFQLTTPHLNLILDLIGYAKKYRRV